MRLRVCAAKRDLRGSSQNGVCPKATRGASGSIASKRARTSPGRPKASVEERLWLWVVAMLGCAAILSGRITVQLLGPVYPMNLLTSKQAICGPNSSRWERRRAPRRGMCESMRNQRECAPPTLRQTYAAFVFSGFPEPPASGWRDTGPRPIAGSARIAPPFRRGFQAATPCPA